MVPVGIGLVVVAIATFLIVFCYYRYYSYYIVCTCFKLTFLRIRHKKHLKRPPSPDYEVISLNNVSVEEEEGEIHSMYAYDMVLDVCIHRAYTSNNRNSRIP